MSNPVVFTALIGLIIGLTIFIVSISVRLRTLKNGIRKMAYLAGGIELDAAAGVERNINEILRDLQTNLFNLANENDFYKNLPGAEEARAMEDYVDHNHTRAIMTLNETPSSVKKCTSCGHLLYSDFPSLHQIHFDGCPITGLKNGLAHDLV